MDKIDIDVISADLKTCRARITALQCQTFECVTVASTGKITVKNKDTLENLNAEIGRLQAIEARNSEVLERLRTLLGERTIRDLVTERNRLQEAIFRTKSLYRVDVGNLIRYTHGLDPEKVFEDPRARDLKAKFDVTLDKETRMLAETEDMIGQAESIIAEFEPSGVGIQEGGHYSGIVTRLETGGMA